ncbi:MAG: hypothetical protein E6780_03680 [Staphylococcus epidermidis]|nr:hypothetical protein [Staphylococcus epidermidis]
MNKRKVYEGAKLGIQSFLLRNPIFDNLSDVEIAKMLAELSISYLKYPVLEARGELKGE